jgi:predicted small secreted protein
LFIREQVIPVLDKIGRFECIKNKEGIFKEYKKMVKKALLIIILFLVAFSAIGCQTVQGIGGDIRWLGGARDNE